MFTCPSGIKYTVVLTDINDIMVGDIIEHGGILKTVCRGNIKRGGFCGTTLFGDSYHSGYKKVKRAIIYRATLSHKE